MTTRTGLIACLIYGSVMLGFLIFAAGVYVIEALR